MTNYEWCMYKLLLSKIVNRILHVQKHFWMLEAGDKEQDTACAFIACFCFNEVDVWPNETMYVLFLNADIKKSRRQRPLFALKWVKMDLVLLNLKDKSSLA